MMLSNRGAAQTTAYTYDDLNRLTQVEYSDGTLIAYQYDKLGNCTALTITAGGCAATLVLTGTLGTNIYRSQGILTAHDAIVPNGAVVEFISDTGILLDYNFTVELGADFEAYIEACPANAGNSQGSSKLKNKKQKKALAQKED